MVVMVINLGNSREEFKGKIWGMLSLNILWDKSPESFIDKKPGSEGRDPG